MGHGRGQIGFQNKRSSFARNRHPNWGHPDHDACGTGFVARLGGAPSYEIIQISLTALERLTHRGGVDADGASGDGAGLLTSLPHRFFRERAQELQIELRFFRRRRRRNFARRSKSRQTPNACKSPVGGVFP